MHLHIKVLFTFTCLCGFVSLKATGPLELHIKVTNPTCPGMCNGMVNLTVTGGHPEYRYYWPNGLRTKDYRDACAGSGEVLVRDEAGDSARISFVIKDPPPIGIENLIVKQPSAGMNNGSLEVHVTGGLLPYSFSVDGLNYSTSNIFSQLKPDLYVISIKDASECLVQSGTITLKDSDKMKNLDTYVNLYSNPQNKDIHMYSIIPLSFVFTDLTGRVMAEEGLKTDHNIPLDSADYGLYLLTISDGEHFIYKKIVRTSEY